jgi:hypothetical protein
MPQRHHLRPSAAALALAAVTALAAAPPATSAATPQAKVGTATVTLDALSAAKLRAAGVSVSAASSAVRAASTITLPVTRASVGSGATLAAGGRLTFRRGPRSATFTSLRITASGTGVALSGVLGGRRTTLASGRPAAGALSVNRTTGAVALTKAKLTFGHLAARSLVRILKLRRAPAGLGSLKLSAVGTTTPSGPSTPALPPSPTAVPVTSATIVWHVRDSFVQYVNSGEGTSVSGGATADPKGSGCTSAGAVNDAQLGYQFRFPFTRGTYDTATGRADLQFAGTVNFRYSGHTIDLDMGDPLVTVAGGASVGSFRFSGRDGTSLKPTRSPFVALTPNAPEPKRCSVDPGPSGLGSAAGVTNADGTRTFTQDRMPGTITKDGAAIFDTAGFGYPPNDPFGWISVTYTVAAPAR